MKEFATPRQAEYVDAIIKHGGISAAARALKVHKSTISRRVEAIERRAALQGYAPAHDLTHTAPAPFLVKGTSTLYGEDGKLKAQWVKTSINGSQVEQVLREFVADLVEDVKGRSKIVPPPAHTEGDLLAAYAVGDPHFGMYSWAAETGDDFDAEIADQITTAAMDRLVGSAPKAEVALLLVLGDLMHADDTTNRTPAHGYPLDVDTRLPKVLQIALRVLKRAIYRMLEKHLQVIVRIVAGNHDPHSSFAIALALSEHFENNKRVRIDLSPSLFWFYRFGKVLIGATHGDKTKDFDLLGVMAADRSADWGETAFRYFYHGHIHHKKVIELPGMIVESFRTLAPKDAWHAGKGYRAGRDMVCVVHHKEFGEIERHTCGVAMIQQGGLNERQQ